MRWTTILLVGIILVLAFGFVVPGIGSVILGAFDWVGNRIWSYLLGNWFGFVPGAVFGGFAVAMIWKGWWKNLRWARKKTAEVALPAPPPPQLTAEAEAK